MNRLIIWIYLLGLPNGLLFGQEDSIKLVLLNPPQEIVYEPYPAPWSPYPPYPPIIDWGVGLIDYKWILLPGCGEEFYENGQKRYSAPCLNGKLHGKLIQWNLNGVKTSESTYNHGKLLKSKTYAKGYLASVNFYRQKDGEQKLHGKQTSYLEDQIILAWYDYGKKQSEKIITKKSKKLVLYRHFDNKEKLDTLKAWDLNGNLLRSEFYKEGEKVGSWETVDTSINQRTVTSYYGNVDWVTTIFFGDTKIGYAKYANNLLQQECSWYPSGHKLKEIFFDSNRVAHTLVYDENGEVLKDVYTQNEQYCNKGFWPNTGGALTTIHYEVYANDSFQGVTPLKCWVLMDGDTLIEKYKRNSTDSYQFSHTLRENRFEKAEDGTYKRHGVWANYYANNYLYEVLTYRFGILDGKYVRYQIKNELPTPVLIGNYENNIRSGKWEENLTDSLTIYSTYSNDVLNGIYYEIFADNDTLVRCTYQAGQKEGSYVDFYVGNKLKSQGNFSNDRKEGYWIYFSESGQILEEGEYSEGKRTAKWFIWEENRKGQLKKRKIRAV